MYETYNFLFTDEATDEDFIVEVEAMNIHEAKNQARYVADEYFDEPRLVEQITEEEAECLGIDTYTEE
ncbi:MAG: hypothetical protein J6Q67_04995 [Clostridia bacterium]|nr:hypothetical protein [Clostridia bacterium]